MADRLGVSPPAAFQTRVVPGPGATPQGVAELRFEIDTVQELQTELHASSGCIDACFGDSARSAGHRRFEFRRSATAPSALPTTASRSVATLQGCDNALRHGGRYVMAAAGWHHARCVLAGNGASNRIRIGIGSCVWHGYASE